MSESVLSEEERKRLPKWAVDKIDTLQREKAAVQTRLAQLQGEIETGCYYQVFVAGKGEKRKFPFPADAICHFSADPANPQAYFRVGLAGDRLTVLVDSKCEGIAALGGSGVNSITLKREG